uniref:Transcription initiation factor TFIID subunit 10 n=1 Tax=Panagrellus redivivus TaxID=6233 RepID=A0A7E4ZYP8_PANRE
MSAPNQLPTTAPPTYGAPPSAAVVQRIKAQSAQDPNRRKTRDQEGCLNSIANFAPAIPDGTARYIMNRAGVNDPTDMAVRTVNVATQKVMTELFTDMMLVSQMRGRQKPNEVGRRVMTMEDLEQVLRERDVRP